MVIKKILNLEPLKQEVIQSVSTQFRASPFERALFSALNRVFFCGYPCTIYEKGCKERYSLNRMTE